MRRILLLTVACSLFISFTPAVSATSLPSSSIHGKPAEWDPALVRSSLEALKNMPRKERKAKLKEAKKEIKNFKAAKKRGEEVDTNLVLMIILALLLPPVAVYLHDNAATTRFWITLLLFLLGVAGVFIFGWWAILAAIIYALIIVLGGA
jgi:uncharacterized membrane protein YqaE (UPF0057 family)